MRYDLTTIQVKSIADMLRDEDDDVLLADMLEAETDLHPMLEKLLGWIEQDEGAAAALKQQVEDRTERKRRFEARVATKREAITALLEIAGLDKLQLPEATLSIRRLPPKTLVADEQAIPDEYVRIKRVPDMAAIKAAVESGVAVPGTTMSNGGDLSLTIRRK